VDFTMIKLYKFPAAPVHTYGRLRLVHYQKDLGLMPLVLYAAAHD
jgi:hypothetical protein